MKSLKYRNTGVYPLVAITSFQQQHLSARWPMRRSSTYPPGLSFYFLVSVFSSSVHDESAPRIIDKHPEYSNDSYVVDNLLVLHIYFRFYFSFFQFLNFSQALALHEERARWTVWFCRHCEQHWWESQRDVYPIEKPLYKASNHFQNNPPPPSPGR